MLLDKLWLRIRGELLTLKEDLAAGDDLRDRARTLMDRLEALVGSSESGRQVPGTDDKVRSESEVQPHAVQELKDIQREWEELKRRKDQAGAETTEKGPAPPNPRTLG